MPKHDIPKDLWIDFCSKFNDTHETWLSVLHITDDGAHGPIGRNLPFKGLSAELGRPGRQDQIYIQLGDAAERGILQIIEDPRRMTLLTSYTGESEGVEIESRNKVATLRFPKVLPDGTPNGWREATRKKLLKQAVER
jgi:hypothetical protein